jgi:hypothetical protein
VVKSYCNGADRSVGEKGDLRKGRRSHELAKEPELNSSPVESFCKFLGDERLSRPFNEGHNL